MYFYFYLPRERGVALHLKTLGSLLLKDTLCHVVFNLAQWLRRRGWKYEKLSDKRKTDDRRYEQLTCSSGELKTVQKWQFTESFKLEICFVACVYFPLKCSILQMFFQHSNQCVHIVLKMNICCVFYLMFI